MNLSISPAVTYDDNGIMTTNHKLFGEISVPGDKSITHRAYILGSVTSGTTKVIGGAQGEDCYSTLECLQHMGMKYSTDGESLDTLQITTSELCEPTDILDANNSGTTARLLLGLLSSRNIFACLTGDDSLKQRPMDRVIKPLSKLGAKIAAREQNSYLPAAVMPWENHSVNQNTLAPENTEANKRKPTEPIVIDTEVASAQVKSCLLLASLQYPGKISITEPHLTRDHTERMLEHLGFDVHYPKGETKQYSTVTVNKTKHATLNLQNNKTVIDVPGDISSAAFIIAAGVLIPESRIKILDVGLNPTRIGFIDLIKEMGADIEIENYNLTSGEPRGDVIANYSPNLQGITITEQSVPLAIDELPLLTVLASRAQGMTEISGAEELRYKESDRILAMATELAKMGASIEEKPDGLIIQGSNKLQGTNLDSWGDHRVAMALAIASLAAEGDSTITNADCINISYPEFPEDLMQIGVACKKTVGTS